MKLRTTPHLHTYADTRRCARGLVVATITRERPLWAAQASPQCSAATRLGWRRAARDIARPSPAVADAVLSSAERRLRTPRRQPRAPCPQACAYIRACGRTAHELPPRCRLPNACFTDRHWCRRLRPACTPAKTHLRHRVGSSAQREPARVRGAAPRLGRNPFELRMPRRLRSPLAAAGRGWVTRGVARLAGVGPKHPRAAPSRHPPRAPSPAKTTDGKISASGGGRVAARGGWRSTLAQHPPRGDVGGRPPCRR